MQNQFFVLALTTTLALSSTVSRSAHAADVGKLKKRADNAAAILNEVMSVPDKGIPNLLLKQSVCIAVVPNVVKAAFGFGGQGGYGLATCRTANGWSLPSYLALRGGSFGFQIGVQSTDVVLVFVNDRAAKSLATTDLKMGVNASIAAGPVGRDASADTNYKLQAEIFSYSRSRGLFAGVSLQGSVVNPDGKANRAIYGEDKADPSTLLTTPEAGGAPQEVAAFLTAVRLYAPAQE